MVIVHSWESLRATFEARASEWALAGAIFCLGLVSFFNTTLFQSPNFDGLTEWATQRTWAVGFLTIGFLRGMVLIINGGWWRTPHFRAVFAFLAAGVWFHLMLGFAANLSFALAIMPWLFLLDAYNALRAGREAGIAQLFQSSHKKKENDGAPSIKH